MISVIGYRLGLLVFLLGYAQSLNVVIAGGTGKIGKVLLPQLSHHDVTVLTRNAFLASAPNRVTEEFGWLGQRFLDKNPHVTLRDWDGGDLLEIVGSDFIGWGDDALKEADIIIHSVGGFTAQRTMAAERLVQEALRLKSRALHITVSPREEEIPLLSPGMLTLKKKRIRDCEDIVTKNCVNYACLRLEVFKIDELCKELCQTIDNWSP